MRYLAVAWHHELDDTPVVIYSEVGDDGYETRRVEVYRDGRHDYADAGRSTGETELGEVPVPPIEDIAGQDEFTPAWISADDFERVWRPAVRED